MKKIIIGIDDTDNLESRGTGFLARQLSSYLQNQGVFTPLVIVRHQLFVHEDIPYTSHNSSASISGFTDKPIENVIQLCVNYIVERAASGSDAGLCILESDDFNKSELIEFGLNAKKIILTQTQAIEKAKQMNIFLIGLTGEKTGIIGALAAVALHVSGNDGRVLWLERLRETHGVVTTSFLKASLNIESVLTTNHTVIDDDAQIMLKEWNRPVMRNNCITLYVEPSENNNYEYQTATKEYIKSISE